MPWAPVNGIDLYYEDHGSGTPIVFAHGAGGNHLSWWQQVPAFRDSYRCITIDHRGFGRSQDIPDGPGAAMYQEDLRALLDHLGIDRTFLVAQSMGGSTCIGFAIAHPERVLGLVMADTAGTIEETRLQEIVDALRATQPVPFTLDGRAYDPSFAVRAPALAFLYDQIRALTPPLDLARLRSQRPPAQYIATPEKLANFRVPTLFIVGSLDAIIPPAAIHHAATLVPGARVVEVPGSGHSVYFEAPEAFNDAVAAFLVEARTAAPVG